MKTGHRYFASTTDDALRWASENRLHPAVAFRLLYCPSRHITMRAYEKSCKVDDKPHFRWLDLLEIDVGCN